MDEAVVDGCSFNGSIFKRALKALANHDFAHADWTNLTTVTKDVIDNRYVKDAEDTDDADSFYSMICSQILQKSLRTATQKFKPKESWFIEVHYFMLTSNNKCLLFSIYQYTIQVTNSSYDLMVVLFCCGSAKHSLSELQL